MQRLHRGVYLVGPLEAPLSRPAAATLAVGAGAVVSHESAAAIWGFGVRRGHAIDVTLAGRAARNRRGIALHRTRQLEAEDATVHRAVPITTPARTLLDLAAMLDEQRLARAVEQAELGRLTTSGELAVLVARRGRHRGCARLAAVLEPDRQMTRSAAERRMLELVAAARLPTPAANTRVGGHEVDFLWPAQRLIVEVDGYAFHSSRAAFERDRERDADLQALGYRIIRLTWRRLTQEPGAAIAAIAAALASA